MKNQARPRSTRSRSDYRPLYHDWRVLGLANSPEERWTLTFDGEKLNVRVKFGAGPEISIDGKTAP